MAVTAQPHQRLTVDEFFALPGEQRHTQLIDGEIVVNAPSMRHQRILYWMAYELETFRRANPHLGSPGLEMDVPVGNHDVYLPDLWWSSPSRLPGPIRFEAMPDLAIEIGSPSTWRFDVGTKKRGYEAAGLPELWLVDTVRDRVILHRRSHPDVTAFDVTFEVTPGEDLTSPLLPGLTLDVAGCSPLSAQNLASLRPWPRCGFSESQRLHRASVRRDGSVADEVVFVLGIRRDGAAGAA